MKVGFLSEARPLWGAAPAAPTAGQTEAGAAFNLGPARRRFRVVGVDLLAAGYRAIPL